MPASAAGAASRCASLPFSSPSDEPLGDGDPSSEPDDPVAEAAEPEPEPELGPLPLPEPDPLPDAEAIEAVPEPELFSLVLIGSLLVVPALLVVAPSLSVSGLRRRLSPVLAAACSTADGAPSFAAVTGLSPEAVTPSLASSPLEESLSAP